MLADATVFVLSTVAMDVLDCPAPLSVVSPPSVAVPLSVPAPLSVVTPVSLAMPSVCMETVTVAETSLLVLEESVET